MHDMHESAIGTEKLALMNARHSAEAV